MTYPALDLGGYSRRTILPQSYVTQVNEKSPGFIANKIAQWTSRIYSQLRKLYGKTIPFGQKPAQFSSVGTNPPGVVLSGVPVLGSMQLVMTTTTPGPIGTAQFSLSLDNGQSITSTGIVSALSWALPGTGITATVNAGAVWSSDNVYTAPAPIDEIFLGWLVCLLNVEVLRKLGVNTTDPQMAEMFEEAKATLAEISEASKSDTGLFDLGVNDGDDSARSTGGPLSFTQVSPYVSADFQEREGSREDAFSASFNFNDFNLWWG